MTMGDETCDLKMIKETGLGNSYLKLNADRTGEDASGADGTDAQFIEWMKDACYKLPESVMPQYLKTDAQRREANVFNESTVNYVEKTVHYDGGYDRWEMAAYLTADKNSMIIIVQYGSGLDGYEMKSDKTVNYNIATGVVTEIERPIDPITVEELIDESLFESPQLAAKAKKYIGENMKRVRYSDFSKDGFKISGYLFGYDDDDYYGEQNTVVSSRVWNGSRFVKGK
jgi:hypothetical protein